MLFSKMGESSGALHAILEEKNENKMNPRSIIYSSMLKMSKLTMNHNRMEFSGFHDKNLRKKPLTFFVAITLSVVLFYIGLCAINYSKVTNKVSALIGTRRLAYGAGGMGQQCGVNQGIGDEGNAQDGGGEGGAQEQGRNAPPGEIGEGGAQEQGRNAPPGEIGEGGAQEQGRNAPPGEIGEGGGQKQGRNAPPGEIGEGGGQEQGRNAPPGEIGERGSQGGGQPNTEDTSPGGRFDGTSDAILNMYAHISVNASCTAGPHPINREHVTLASLLRLFSQYDMESPLEDAAREFERLSLFFAEYRHSRRIHNLIEEVRSFLYYFMDDEPSFIPDSRILQERALNIYVERSYRPADYAFEGYNFELEQLRIPTTPGTENRVRATAQILRMMYAFNKLEARVSIIVRLLDIARLLSNRMEGTNLIYNMETLEGTISSNAGRYSILQNRLRNGMVSLNELLAAVNRSEVESSISLQAPILMPPQPHPEGAAHHVTILEQRFNSSFNSQYGNVEDMTETDTSFHINCLFQETSVFYRNRRSDDRSLVTQCISCLRWVAEPNVRESVQNFISALHLFRAFINSYRVDGEGYTQAQVLATRRLLASLDNRIWEQNGEFQSAWETNIDMSVAAMSTEVITNAQVTSPPSVLFPQIPTAQYQFSDVSLDLGSQAYHFLDQALNLIGALQLSYQSIVQLGVLPRIMHRQRLRTSFENLVQNNLSTLENHILTASHDLVVLSWNVVRFYNAMQVTQLETDGDGASPQPRPDLPPALPSSDISVGAQQIAENIRSQTPLVPALQPEIQRVLESRRPELRPVNLFIEQQLFQLTPYCYPRPPQSQSQSPTPPQQPVHGGVTSNRYPLPTASGESQLDESSVRGEPERRRRSTSDVGDTDEDGEAKKIKHN